MSKDPVTGVILAGGQSRRFGSDKALFELNGRPLIERAYQVLSQVSDSVFVSVGSEHTRYPVPATHLYDKPGYAGPLAGIFAGMAASTTPWILVLAVDLPYVEAADLKRLLAARGAESDAIIARSADRIHPLCACYHRRSLSVAKELLDQGQFAVSGFTSALNTHVIGYSEDTLTNLNTPPG